METRQGFVSVRKSKRIDRFTVDGGNVLVIEIIAFQLGDVSFKSRNILCCDAVLDGDLQDIAGDQQLILGDGAVSGRQKN